MKKVICSLKGAGTNIDGIEFHSENGFMVSYDVPDDIADQFCRMHGFEKKDCGHQDNVDAEELLNDIANNSEALEEAITSIPKRGRPKKEDKS